MRGPLPRNSLSIDGWRKRASRLRALAKVTRDAKERAELLALAKHWDGIISRAAGHERGRAGVASC